MLSQFINSRLRFGMKFQRILLSPLFVFALVEAIQTWKICRFWWDILQYRIGFVMALELNDPSPIPGSSTHQIVLGKYFDTIKGR